MDMFKLACRDCIRKHNLLHSKSRATGRCEFCGKENVDGRLAHKPGRGWMA